jgi:hypothetical protein
MSSAVSGSVFSGLSVLGGQTAQQPACKRDDEGICAITSDDALTTGGLRKTFQPLHMLHSHSSSFMISGS